MVSSDALVARTALFICLATGLAGCSDSASPQRDPLESSRALWESRALDDYEFELGRACFCYPEYVGPARIRVRDDRVESVVYTSNGAPVPDSLITAYWTITIDSLFGKILELRDEAPDTMGVRYNTDLGYPESIYVDFDRLLADDEFDWRVSHIEPSP